MDGVLQDEGWSNFHFSLALDEIAMFHEDHGILPASLLSDGVRATLILAADLALRCVQLNSPLGENAPKGTPGIVLIDEVDLHLHPAWQQRILNALVRAFPKIQFIVTTHSPQVISTIENDCIRIIEIHNRGLLEGEVGEAITPARQTQGIASSDVLTEIFSVDPVPEVEAASKLSEYTFLVQQGLEGSEQGQKIRKELIHHFGPDHPSINEVDRLIRLRRMKARLMENKK